MNPGTGYVKAMVGGRSYQESQWNRATQAHRQTGSAFKLFTYTAAIDRGQFNAVSPFFDGPVVYFTGKRTADERFWSPENYEKYYWGDVFLWEMLAHSINVASVKLLEKVGVNVTIDYARRMGVASSLARDLTLTLGTSGVTLLEMVNAYGTIANYGVYVKPVCITRVETATGELLEQSYFEGERVLSPQTAFVMIDLLTKVVERGTGRRIRWLGFERPCGGKTGTVGWTGEKDTDKTMDAWFLGFTPELVAGVWIGKDDASPLGPRLTGSSAAIPAWTSFMKQALADVPVKDFPSPSGVVFKEIDLETGLLAHEEDGGETDWFAFIEGTAPKLYRSESDKINYRIWERLSSYPTPQN